MVVPNFLPVETPPLDEFPRNRSQRRVRALLCFNCNGALGQFRDRTDLMLTAVAYLRRGAWAELIDRPGVGVGFHVHRSYDVGSDSYETH